MIASGETFLVAITHDDVTPEQKIVHKAYKVLYAAYTYTEAETKGNEELAVRFVGGKITSIVKRNYTEFFLRDGNEHAEDRYYDVKWATIIFDDKTATEKKTTSKTLVQAESVSEALQRFNDEMKGTMADFEVMAVVETTIDDVIINK